MRKLVSSVGKLALLVVVGFVEGVADGFRHSFGFDCRHVCARLRKSGPDGVGVANGYFVVRCHEPSMGDCEFGYCLPHCRAICGAPDGDDGDEDELEPAWEPKKAPDGREKIEA